MSRLELTTSKRKGLFVLLHLTFVFLTLTFTDSIFRNQALAQKHQNSLAAVSTAVRHTQLVYRTYMRRQKGSRRQAYV